MNQKVYQQYFNDSDHLQLKKTFADKMKFKWSYLLHSLPPDLTDTTSYNNILRIWSRVSQSDEYMALWAKALLRKMQEQLNKYDPSFVVRPNYISFTTVIAAWSNSRDLDAAVRSDEIYRLMESLEIEGGMMDDLRPNICCMRMWRVQCVVPQGGQRACWWR